MTQQWDCPVDEPVSLPERRYHRLAEHLSAIANRVASGQTLRAIARDYGVSHEALRQALKRSGYATRPSPVPDTSSRRARTYRLPGRGGSTTFSPEEVGVLLLRHRSGESLRALARSLSDSTDEAVTSTIAYSVPQFTVESSTGEFVWRDPPAPPRPPILPPGETRIVLEPRETKSFTATWNQRRRDGDGREGDQVPPGVYIVRAGTTTSGTDAEPTSVVIAGPTPRVTPTPTPTPQTVDIPGSAMIERGGSVTFRRPFDGATLTVAFFGPPARVTVAYDGATLTLAPPIGAECWIVPPSPGGRYQPCGRYRDGMAIEPTREGTRVQFNAVSPPPLCPPGSPVIAPPVIGPGQVGSCSSPSPTPTSSLAPTATGGLCADWFTPDRRIVGRCHPDIPTVPPGWERVELAAGCINVVWTFPDGWSPERILESMNFPSASRRSGAGMRRAGGSRGGRWPRRSSRRTRSS